MTVTPSASNFLRSRKSANQSVAPRRPLRSCTSRSAILRATARNAGWAAPTISAYPLTCDGFGAESPGPTTSPSAPFGPQTSCLHASTGRTACPLTFWWT